jgi:protein-arginine kinase activator protein McsA
MFCDDCAVEPATIDHLDLSVGDAHLRRLCGRCAEIERTRWNAERLQKPIGLVPAPQGERRAA